MPPPSLERPEVSADEVRAELEKVLVSPAFSRSERSQRFLRYVCDLTLRGEASRIKQYLIGREVFQRGSDYSTDDDPLVRRQAHVLRQKLDAYYARTGREDPVRIELPVGQYVPVFQRQSPGMAGGAPARASGRVDWVRIRLPLLAILSAATLLWVGWALGRRTSVSQVRLQLPAPVREIWGSWLDDPAGLVICLSNPMTAVVKYHSQPAGNGLPLVRLPVTPSQERAFRETFDLPHGGAFDLIPSRVNTKVGDSLSAVLLATFFTKATVPVRATQSRLVTWEDLRTQNFILLGHNEANPWIDPLLSKYPLRLGETQGRRLRYIINTSPLAGEASEYQVEQPEGKNQPAQEYALISMIPGLDARRRLLLISGLNTQATQIAAELLTETDHLEQLLSRLKAIAPAHHGPWYFQVVVRAEVRDKVPTTGPEIVVLRVL